MFPLVHRDLLHVIQVCRDTALSKPPQAGGMPSAGQAVQRLGLRRRKLAVCDIGLHGLRVAPGRIAVAARSEEHTSELQSLMRISYAVFCLKKKKKNT